MIGRQVADKSEIVAFDCILDESLRDLIEHPLIDHASLALRAGVLERNERFPEKFAHPAVDLSRTEIVIVQKNLETGGRFLVVIRKSDRNFRRRLGGRRELARG